MEQNGIWQEEWNIPSFMIGRNLQAGITAICNILQNTAGLHALQHGLGFDGMQKIGQVWVLNRLKVSMNQFPVWHEKIQIQSWVSSMRGPFSDRHFALHNQQGELIGSASTFWVAVSIANRKPARIVKSSLPIHADKFPACGTTRKLPKVTEFDHESTYQVQYIDLDMVNHVNNVKYVEWMLNHLIKIEEGFSPTHLEMNFVSEALFAEKMVIKSKKLEEGFACVVLKEEGEIVVCRGEFR